MTWTLLGAVSCLPRPQGGAPSNPLPIPRPGKDGSYGGDQFFQYINVPALNTFEWGYRRGNADHNIEEYLSQKDSTFKSKVNIPDNNGLEEKLVKCFLFSVEVARCSRRTWGALLRL